MGKISQKALSMGKTVTDIPMIVKFPQKWVMKRRCRLSGFKEPGCCFSSDAKLTKMWDSTSPLHISKFVSEPKSMVLREMCRASKTENSNCKTSRHGKTQVPYSHLSCASHFYALCVIIFQLLTCLSCVITSRVVAVATTALLLPGLSWRDRDRPETKCTPSSVTLTLSSSTLILLSASTDDVTGDNTCKQLILI